MLEATQPTHILTVEEVDKQLEELQKTHGAKAILPTGQGVIDINSICAIVTMATPILKFIRAILFWKPKWQGIIDQVIGATSFCSGD